jgi:hypothetical protein
MSCHSRGLAVGGHDDCFLIVDRVGQDFVVGVRAHTGEVSTVYLMDVDIEKLVKFLSEKRDVPAEMRLLPAKHTVGEAAIGSSETGE